MSIRQQAITDNYTACTPFPGYDECWEIDRADMVTWQDSVAANDTPWRTTSLDFHNQRIDVTIDSRELNAHVIPTASGQGYYDTWQELESTIRVLLGSSIFNQGDLVTYDEWVKLDGDDVAFGETGDFVIDAISNADGEIWVDGVKVFPDSGGGCDPVIGCMTATASTTDTFSWSDQGNGTSEARLKAFATNLFAYRSHGSQIDSYRKDGKTSKAEWGCAWWPPHCWYRTHKMVASSMTITNKWYAKDKYMGYMSVGRDTVRKRNVSSLSHRVWAVGIPAAQLDVDAVCAEASVSDKNGTGSGYAGTRSGCLDY